MEFEESDQASLFNLAINSHLERFKEHPSDDCEICKFYGINPLEVKAQKGLMSYKFIMLDLSKDELDKT